MKKKIITALVILGLVIAIPTGVMYNKELKAWNDGYCITCDNELEYFDVKHLKPNRFKYTWYCDNCHHIEQFHFLFQ